MCVRGTILGKLNYTWDSFIGLIIILTYGVLGCVCRISGVFTPEQDNKTNVEPLHSYDAFHTRSDKPGVKGIIGMQRLNICLVLSLSCSGVKTP